MHSYLKQYQKIFFYCVQEESPEKASFHHLMINLGEGLRELGWQLYSNVNYWRYSPNNQEYLFRFDPSVTPDDCSIVVLDSGWLVSSNGTLPENLFHSNRKYITVFLDNSESSKVRRTKAWSPEFRQFDFIFRTHFNEKFHYPSNFYPWAFGLSNRILRETENLPPFQERKQNLLVNFRHTRWMHSVRKTSHKEFEPLIQKILPIDNRTDRPSITPLDPYHYLQWLQTGKRHYPTYYQNLKRSAACSCFGGYFVPPLPRNPGTNITSKLRRIFADLGLKSKVILQWDSWRFWESLAAGCVSFHVDFEKYGIFLPVMPENWRHYIGIDLDNIQDAVDRIAEEPEILERISVEGRLWAIEHYSPLSTALRFLETIGKKRRYLKVA